MGAKVAPNPIGNSTFADAVVSLNYAAIGPIATYLPEKIETNADLKAQYPSWDLDLIEEKTGIAARHIAAPDQCSSDLGVLAAERLFQDYDIDRASIDFLLLCTQTPDYPLPTTACLLQQRLGLPVTTGALDFNLGCSGFVYGVSLANGLIQSGAARRVLLVTAETYSKFIHPDDRSLRTIFGDGAAATLLDAAPRPALQGFCFGTDGSGADTLLVTRGGHRPETAAHRPRHRQRWQSDLYMDGPSLISFTVGAIPKLVDDVLTSAQLARDQVDYYIFHQATSKMLLQLQQRLELADAQMPIELADCGNTVSSTIPLVIERMRADGRLKPGVRSMLLGFGVGWSWAGCMWEETAWPA